MATRRWGVSAGESQEDVTEGVGAAVAADTVELTVDIAATAVNAGGSTRVITREEVLEAIEKIKNRILEDKWPPA